MTKKKFSLIQNIGLGAFFIILGILFFIRFESIWFLLYLLTIFALLLLGFSKIFELIFKNKYRNWIEYLPILSSFGFSLFIWLFPDNFYKFVHIIIGFWVLLNGIIGFISYYVYRRDSLKGASWIFTKSFIDLIISLSLMLAPQKKLWFLSYIAAVYFIFYGLITISENAKDLLPDSTKNKVRKHLSISTPVIICALIPQRFYFSINSMIKKQHVQIDANACDGNSSDLEIFIYLKAHGPESLGHVDICFNNTIYSYGCHDPENRGLHGTLGDGVLIVSDRNSFLQNSINGDDKTIISYQFTLTTSQKEILSKRIQDLMERTVTWSCKAKIADDENHDNALINDYASRVYKSCHAKMYKFTQGKFKTYFVFSTNCVLLADALIRTKDLDLIKTSGIVTPGSYIAFLNQQLSRENSYVTNRVIYRKK